jgi:hypothetical protein
MMTCSRRFLVGLDGEQAQHVEQRIGHGDFADQRRRVVAQFGLQIGVQRLLQRKHEGRGFDRTVPLAHPAGGDIALTTAVLPARHWRRCPVPALLSIGDQVKKAACLLAQFAFGAALHGARYGQRV